MCEREVLSPARPRGPQPQRGLPAPSGRVVTPEGRSDKTGLSCSREALPALPRRHPHARPPVPVSGTGSLPRGRGTALSPQPRQVTVTFILQVGTLRLCVSSRVLSASRMAGPATPPLSGGVAPQGPSCPSGASEGFPHSPRWNQSPGQVGGSSCQARGPAQGSARGAPGPRETWWGRGPAAQARSRREEVTSPDDPGPTSVCEQACVDMCPEACSEITLMHRS